MKDLHIHIERGEYEKAWIDKFVDRAVKMNIDEINLLEHTIRIREFHPCFAEAEKYSLYQRAGVREYWIVDPDRKMVLAVVLEGGQYHSPEIYTAQDKAPVSVLDGCEIDLATVFEGI